MPFSNSSYQSATNIFLPVWYPLTSAYRCHHLMFPNFLLFFLHFFGLPNCFIDSVATHSLRCLSFWPHPFSRFCDGLHLLQTFLHMIQMFISYMLMLIVMTYNVYMLIAVLLGFTLGYYIFSRNRPLMLRSPQCCH
ncbi:unnamed protein product [Echinostoma caproni]|uniref:Copper transport protein n=1 Tax=Echinostoma caproni TaxID=27848 RepID=A0A183B6B4_9TREM|nr:unnamed protein product [Echinostoma caproni]